MPTSKKNKKSNRFDDLSPHCDESFCGNVTEVGEAVDKLIRFRGGHRAAFTKLEMKLHDLVANPISDEGELIQAEALVAAIKTKHQCITRYDAEVELKTDNDRLADDVERSTTWEQRMMVTEARRCSTTTKRKAMHHQLSQCQPHWVLPTCVATR